MPYFICPNCKERSIDHDAREEIDDIPVACHRCGFGVFELTGFPEQELMGRDVLEGLELSGFDADRNPAQLALEWGVRRMGEQLELRTRAGQRKPVTADFFPAYDEDGGLLVALTPR
jgi:hypothetical protein